jgi:hypothetical protein
VDEEKVLQLKEKERLEIEKQRLERKNNFFTVEKVNLAKNPLG